MLFRKRWDDLKKWKEASNNGLLVYGARQVGKTFLIREFCKQEFDRTFEFNFHSEPDALSSFLEIKNADDLIARISLFRDGTPKAGKDVIFFDEIQEYYKVWNQKDDDYKRGHSDIITLLKTLADQYKIRVIMSGSLLGVSMFQVKANPVGYVDEMTIYPLDFEEFLLAADVDKGIIELAKESFRNEKEVPPSIHERLLKLFREYVVVGGMPKAVGVYFAYKDMSVVSMAQGNVLSWYRKDILQYAPAESRLIIASLFEMLPSEISAKNKKFTKSHMQDFNFKNLDLHDRFLWLFSAGIAIPVFNVFEIAAPLKLSEDYKTVKLFSNDSGLLMSEIFDDDGRMSLITTDQNRIDLGFVYENVAASLLLCHGFQPRYHISKKRGEIDFVVEKNLDAFPIEIKSGKPNKDGKYEHGALNNLLSQNPNIGKAYVFGFNNVFHETEHIVNMPLYMIDFLSR